MTRLTTLLPLAGALLFSSGAAAQETPGAFVGTLVTELSATAENEALGEAERDAAFREALQAALATDAIGRFLFAGAPAELATPEQKAEYEALFPAYIAASFADQIGELAEREIVVGRTVDRPKSEAIVQSKLMDREGAPRATIDWRVREVDGEPRLLDVMVERVSPLIARRQEFSAIAKRDGVDALIAHMRGVATAQ